ncbi:MAG: hypothetical protein IJH12_09460 [Clostridia bacterium]|nr:hypothetical protein [Clostridia bacterium]
MSKFFTKKKIAIIAIATIITIIVAVLVGVNISSSKKAKEKLAEKAKVEAVLEEKKEVAEKIKKVKTEDKKTEEELEEENYSEEYKEYLKLSDEEKSKQEVVPRKEKVEYSELKKIREDQKEDIGKEYVQENDYNEKQDNQEQNKEDQNGEKEDDDKQKEEKSDDIEILPKKFNLNEKINVVVEDQRQFGLCWDFASVKSLETNLALTEGKDYDFSESHIDYMTSNLMSSMIREENNGGNFSDMKSYNEMYKGFVLEEEVPLNVYEEYEYNTFYNIPKEELYITKYAEFPTFYRYEDMSQEEYDSKRNALQTAVKTHIMNYGSIYAVIAAPDYGKNHYMKDYTDAEDSRGSHAISIVGWDDTYSKDNFLSPKGNKPENDGAYIALNSWGTNWGDGGYFYISYEDCRVHSQMSGVVSVNKKSDLVKISSLEDGVRKYVRDNYARRIVIIDGEEYLREINMLYVDLSNMELENIDEYGVLLNCANHIDLSNNNLENIESLAQYINKENVTINLTNNKIKDVSCLRDIKINSLILDGNYGVTGYDVLDISFKLSLENCGVTVLENVENIKDIGVLNLSCNTIEDYSKLSNLTQMYYLELRDCGLESLEKIKDVLRMENLDYLNLSYNKLNDISGLEDSSLYEINLSYNTEISNFEPVRKMRNIEALYLEGCNINDAQDILVEHITEDDIEKMQALIEGEFWEDYYYGVNYILSNNKGISNLKVLKNAVTLVLEDCDLNDISELKEIKYLKNINLSHNHNLSGDLSGLTYNEITLVDCNLNDEFDLFNVESVNTLDVSENNVKNIDKIKDKVLWLLRMDSYDGEKELENGLFIYTNENDDKKNKSIQIEIPDDDGLEMNFTRYVKSIGDRYYNVKIDGRETDSNIIIIPVNENTTISYDGLKEKTDITFKLNNKLKNDGIEVVYNPYLSKMKDEEQIDAKELKVANTYGSCITKITDNYVVDNDVFVLPSKIVERKYNKEMSYIYVREKYYCNVTQESYRAPFTVGEREGAITDDEILDEDLTPPEGFEEEFPTLTFSSEELYYIAKDYWDGLYVSADDDLYIITLKEYREVNDSGLPMYIPRKFLYDVSSLNSVIGTDIYILMDEENGLDRIEEEELKTLESFKRLSVIHIITPIGNYNRDDLIIPQDKYVVEIENGVG